MKKLDILGLKAFVAVAEQGGFRRAAEQLNVTSTAVSRRVQKLEDSLGALLISRTTREVTLTRTGAEFLPRAQEALGALEEVFSDLRARGRHGESRVTFGCLATVAAYFMPDLLAEFTRVRPGTQIRIQDVSATQIIENVRNEQADFGVTFMGAEHFDLTAEPLYTEPLVLCVARGNPLAKRDSITWTELTEHDLIAIGQLSGTRRLIDDSLGGHDLRLRYAYEVRQLHTALRLAASGAGVTVLPWIAAHGTMASVRTIPVVGPEISRTIGLLRRNDIPLTRLADGLRRMITAKIRGVSLPINSQK